MYMRGSGLLSKGVGGAGPKFLPLRAGPRVARALVGPPGPLWAFLGPCGPGPCGQDPCGPPGPLWAGP